MRLQAKIQKWGNSLAIRLSGAMKELPHFEENMLVMVEVTEAGIQVTPIRKNKTKKLRFSEKQLLKGLTAKTAHADELAKLTDKELGD